MRSVSLAVLVFLALVVLPAAPAHGMAPLFAAADKPHDDHGHGAEAGKSDALDPFKGSVDLALFSIVVFLILFTILSLFAWPQIRQGLDKREHAIAHDKQEAEKAKKEAAEVKTGVEKQRAEADEKIRLMMDKARTDAAAAAAEELAKGKADLAAERERMQRELKMSTDDALHRIWEQAASLATMISTKAVRKQLNLDDHRALVSEALDDFKKSAQSRLSEMQEARG